MSIFNTWDTKEDVASEIYYNGSSSSEFKSKYATWQEFMNSDDFEEEMTRLRNKFS